MKLILRRANIEVNICVMYVISLLEEVFETGHGKGTCSGVGSTAYSQGDSAVKRQIFKNADDFFALSAVQEHNSLVYMSVLCPKFNSASDDLKKLNIKPVKGTTSVHSTEYSDVLWFLCNV